ncbi:hypothetical protein AMS68_001776 [Peltaster fructicola]|uniref:Uncharacterized protein n=1 Tax=Peltaster fructicola TaxID=286661 RepID=A0A6H0XNQ4_9PEZI|nr:hypothetical protein AMS68_001776 [Peltaster fructicola]
MPSARTSPSMRPASPLSSRYEPSRFESLLQPPSPRSVANRSMPSGRRTNTSLRLPTLPRFHPANFPSPQGSFQNTPDEEGSARAPLSPRTHQRMYSEAQKQLLMYHRDAVAAARATSPLREKPLSPRLLPMGSPGLPVHTHLELEGEQEYFVAGTMASVSSKSRKELVDSLAQKEVRQVSRKSPGVTTRTRS